MQSKVKFKLLGRSECVCKRGVSVIFVVCIEKLNLLLLQRQRVCVCVYMCGWHWLCVRNPVLDWEKWKVFSLFIWITFNLLFVGRRSLTTSWKTNQQQQKKSIYSLTRCSCSSFYYCIWQTGAHQAIKNNLKNARERKNDGMGILATFFASINVNYGQPKKKYEKEQVVFAFYSFLIFIFTWKVEN